MMMMMMVMMMINFSIIIFDRVHKVPKLLFGYGQMDRPVLICSPCGCKHYLLPFLVLS